MVLLIIGLLTSLCLAAAYLFLSGSVQGQVGSVSHRAGLCALDFSVHVILSSSPKSTCEALPYHFTRSLASPFGSWLPWLLPGENPTVKGSS